MLSSFFEVSCSIVSLWPDTLWFLLGVWGCSFLVILMRDAFNISDLLRLFPFLREIIINSWSETGICKANSMDRRSVLWSRWKYYDHIAPTNKWSRWLKRWYFLKVSLILLLGTNLSHIKFFIIAASSSYFSFLIYFIISFN